MSITHVLRGEDLLPSTPRQLALYAALSDRRHRRIPQFAHLPMVLGEGNKKLSKRDPQSNLLPYRDARLPPRGPAELPRPSRLVVADDRDFFTLDEMVAAFDVATSTPTPRGSTRRRPRHQCGAIRQLSADDFAPGCGRTCRPPVRCHRSRRRQWPWCRRPYLGAGRTPSSRVPRTCTSCWCPTGTSRLIPNDAAKLLGPDAAAVLEAALAASTALRLDDAGDRGGVARRAGGGARPQAPAGLRPGPGGRDRPAVSPPLFESLALLGRERSLDRLRAALTVRSRACDGRRHRRKSGCTGSLVRARLRRAAALGVWGNWQPN